MNTPSTTEELRRLETKATKGPWTAKGPEIWPPGSEAVPYADGSGPTIARTWGAHSSFECENFKRLLLSGDEDENAALIVAMRNSLLPMLDELDRLRSALAKAEQDRDDWKNSTS